MQFKKIISVLLAACLMLAMFAACSEEPSAPKATNKPSASATANATTKPSEKPTEAPTPTPVPTENPHASYFDVEGIVTRFDEADESYTTMSACEASVDGNDPFLTVVSLEGDKNIIVPFGEYEEFDPAEYPYVAIRYRVGYGNSIGAGNHFYAVTSTGGPSANDGWWYHPEMTADADWHLLVIDLPKAFPAAIEGATFKTLRFPIAAEENGTFCIAYMGAFKTEADITSFDTGYTLTYAEKLVKDKAPTEKEENELDAESEFTSIEVDFDDGTAGEGLMGSYITGDLNYTPGTNTSKFVDVDGDIVAGLEFDALSTMERLENGKGYTLTFDVKNQGNTATNFAGLVLNYGREGNTSNDFYENNGILGDSQGSIVSKSGIGVFFQEGTKIKVYVITHNLDTNKIEHISYEFETGIDFSSQFVKFKAVDDGKGKVALYANDTLLATVTYADDAVLPLTATAYNERYYRTASILDASGNTIASTDSALISYTKAYGFGARAHTIYIDDVKVENN